MGDDPSAKRIASAAALQAAVGAGVIGTAWWLGASPAVTGGLAALYGVSVGLRGWMAARILRHGPTRSLGTLSIALEPAGAPLRCASDLPPELRALGAIALLDQAMSFWPVMRSAARLEALGIQSFDPRRELQGGVRAALAEHRDAAPAAPATWSTEPASLPAAWVVSGGASAPRGDGVAWQGVELVEDRRGLRYEIALGGDRSAKGGMDHMNDRVLALVRRVLAEDAAMTAAAKAWLAAYDGSSAQPPAGFRAAAARVRGG